jgi:competence protein ComEC
VSRPLLLLAAALAAGTWLGQDCRSLSQATGLLVMAAATGLLALLARAGPARRAVAAAAFALGAGAAGVERAAYDRAPLRVWAVAQEDDPAPVQLSGVAVRDGRLSGSRLVLVIDVESATVDGALRPLRGRARVDVGGDGVAGLAVMQGQPLTLWAQLGPPRGFRTPGAFDAAGQAFRDGIHAQGYCKSARLVTVEPRLGGPPWSRLAARLRARARAAFARWMLPGSERALVAAMVIGDRSGVDADTSEAFRAAGTYHVLAISGAQVALVAAVLLFALRRVRVPPDAAALATCLALAFYAELVGGDVPVVRAAVMGTALLAGRALSLEADAANLLGLAAAALLVARPSSLGDAGFQLSFGATLGILLLTRPLLERVPPLPLRLDLALAGSLAAQLALLPVLAAQFQRLTPAALLLNFAAVPLSAAVLVSGLAVLGCAAVAPWAAPFAGEVAWAFAHALLRSADLVRLLPSLDLRVAPPPLWAVGLQALGLATLARRGRRAAAVPLGLALLGMIAGPGVPADGRLHVDLLDVGQGDAIVVRGPSGRVMVVDTGAAGDRGLDLGQSVVAPYLWVTGVRRIDRLLITHAHPDHAGGAPFLLSHFDVGEEWEGPAPRSDPSYDALGAAAARAGVRRRTVVRGLVETWDGITLEVVGPGRLPRAPWKVRNDDSVAVALRLGGVRILLTGDMEKGGEAALPVTAAAVLKVPHHGSRTSSSEHLLDGVRPRLAVASAGARNTFGHPHPEVVARYRRRGVQFLNTGWAGTIRLATDGQRLWVATAESPLEQLVQEGP